MELEGKATLLISLSSWQKLPCKDIEKIRYLQEKFPFYRVFSWKSTGRTEVYYSFYQAILKQCSTASGINTFNAYSTYFFMPNVSRRIFRCVLLLQNYLFSPSLQYKAILVLPPPQARSQDVQELKGEWVYGMMGNHRMWISAEYEVLCTLLSICNSCLWNCDVLFRKKLVPVENSWLLEAVGGSTKCSDDPPHRYRQEQGSLFLKKEWTVFIVS